jgi:hypothetical protein
VKRAVRLIAYAGAGAAAATGLLCLSVLLALASVGVFATARDGWTTEVPVAGFAMRVNVTGLLRLATLPGAAHLLDGRSIQTRAGPVSFARTGLALRVTCAPCRLEHPDLAAVPLQLRSIALELLRTGDELDGRLVVDRVEVPFKARMRANGIDLAWTLPSTELASLYGALGETVPEAAFARIEGRVAARGTLSLPSLRTSVNWSADNLEVGGLGTERLQYGWFRFACAQPDGTARLVISGDGEGTWTAADAFGPYLPAAVLAAEDQRFHAHRGYDEREIAAILADFGRGGPKRGGSTITQQLARTLYTGGDRTAVRKLRELLYAIEMERTLGKARILELYLNTVDWGPGLCGARSAARAYFRKSPARLTAIEAAWLAGILRNPHAAWEQQYATRQPDRARAVRVLMQMREWPMRERRRWTAQPIAFAPAAAKPSATAPSPAAARSDAAPPLRASR